MIHGTGEHALARGFDQAPAIRPLEPIRLMNGLIRVISERLIIELGELDDPHTTSLQRRILATQISHFVV
jgi:hypothetical protein